MKVYDAFLFNNEFDLLNLRLNFLDDVVDHFVIVESRRTLSGIEKPLQFKNNKHLYQQFLHKIIYLEAPVNNLPAWEYEYFQRNYLKQGLQSCNENDIVHISDVDEILNLPSLLPGIVSIEKPRRIKTNMYYYWFNLKANVEWCYNLLGKWKDIKNVDIGNRFENYPKHFDCIKPDLITGWHFSYLFGQDIKMYQEKIQSFSHDEYNTSYYLDADRIKKCVSLGIDIFERDFMRMQFSNKELEPVLHLIHQLQLDKYLYRPDRMQCMQLGNLRYFLKVSARHSFSSLKKSIKKIISRH